MHYLYKTKPYKKQAEAFYKAYDKEFFALFMQQGTGKTKVSIDIASNYFVEGKINAVMVIAPNGVHEQWQDEQLEEHSPVPYHAFLWSTKKTKDYTNRLNNFIYKKTEKLKWFCVNVETFSSDRNINVFRDYCLRNNVYIIVDEATRIKTPTSKRFFNISYGLNDFVKVRKAIKKVAYLSKYRSILTGTMVTNSPYDLWAMFEYLKFNFFGMNYFGFKSKYGLEVKDTIREKNGRERIYHRKITKEEILKIKAYVNQGYTIWDISNKIMANPVDIKYIIDNPGISVPYKNMHELKAKISDHCIIIRKDECLDLPEKVYEKVFIKMNTEQTKIYKDLKDELLSVYHNKELSVPNKLSLLGRLQQVTGGYFPYTEDLSKGKFTRPEPIKIAGSNPKIEYIKLDMEENGDEQIIIWSRYVAEIKAITQELQETFPEKVIKSYFGGISKEERRKTISLFKDSKVDILVANPSVAGTGLNLQSCSLNYIFSCSFSSEEREQLEDRTHRGGQQNTCVYKDLLVKGTVDEKIYSALMKHRSLLEYFRETEIREII